MTLKELERELSACGIEEAKWEAMLILERLFGQSPASLMVNRECDFDSAKINPVLEKRKNRIPLQYIFGEWDFMGIGFYVSEGCLIPRPDTEILVQRALSELKTGDRVADLCTGSGCIGLSLLMHSDKISHLTLMDISNDALEISKKNAKRYSLDNKCRFILGDITKDMPNEKFDMIASNPPYIPTRDIEGLGSEVKKEPHIALDGGCDGLDIIRFLISDGLDYLKPKGIMLIEFGYDQGQIMDTLFKEKQSKGLISSYEILYDYGGNTRACILYRS